MPSTINQRIEHLIEKLEMSKNGFAKRLGTSSGRISNITTGRNKPDSDILAAIKQAYGVNGDWLLDGEGEIFRQDSDYSHLNEGATKYENTQVNPQVNTQVKGGVKLKSTQNLALEDAHLNAHPNAHLSAKVNLKSTQNLQRVVQPVLVTVDAQQIERITYVPVKARAGYLRGYGDPVYVQKLPNFNIPGLTNDVYRAFEVDGYSMLAAEGAGLYPSDLVVGSYIERAEDIRDTRVYVIVSTEGIFIKRCINRLKTDAGKLILNSDNKNGEYPPIILDRHQIIEVWEARGKWSRQLPMPGQLFDTVIDLQARMILLEDELKKLNR